MCAHDFGIQEPFIHSNPTPLLPDPLVMIFSSASCYYKTITLFVILFPNRKTSYHNKSSPHCCQLQLEKKHFNFVSFYLYHLFVVCVFNKYNINSTKHTCVHTKFEQFDLIRD